MSNGVHLPLPRQPRYESLDAWRGIACLLVVVSHSIGAGYPRDWNASWTTEPVGTALMYLGSWTWLGVPMFFVISGYCISATVDSTRRKSSGRGISFFTRRFRRIFPPYWIWLGFSVALLALLPGLIATDSPQGFASPGSLTLSQWFGNLTLTESWRWHLFGTTPWRLLLPHAWTLCYEEQFYAVCGLLLLVSPRRFFLAAGMVTCLVLVTAVTSFKSIGFSFSGSFLDGQWLLFAAGMLIYVKRCYATRQQSRLIDAALLLAFLGCLGLRLGVMELPRMRFTAEARLLAWSLVFGSGFAVLMSLLEGWDASLARARVLWPLTWCGQMCYSLYLVHATCTVMISQALAKQGITGIWPTLLVTLPLAMTAAILASRLFHELVEKRFLNPPSTLLAPRSAPASVSEQSERASRQELSLVLPQ